MLDRLQDGLGENKQLIRKVLNVDYHRSNSKTDSMNTKASSNAHSINRDDSLENLVEEAADKNNQRRSGIVSKEHQEHDKEMEALLMQQQVSNDSRQSLVGATVKSDAMHR